MKTYLIPLIIGLLALGACGSGNGTAAPSAAPSADLEKDVTAYVECLRKQGLDLPDPTVDAKGQISFGRPVNGQTIDRDKLAAAQKVCGEPPAGLAAAAGVDVNDPAFQDAALKFAQCMRGQGVNVADPDFSKAGTGGGLFGGIDRDDPKVAAAVQACQHVFADAGVRLPGGNG